MIKHLTSQRYVFKIHSSRLRRSKWNLTLTPNQARENKELISLSESQLMRFIDEINCIENAEIYIASVKKKINSLKRETNLANSRPKIKKLYLELDDYQFKKDYVCVVIDKDKDYIKMYKNGFKINGITYKRLLGTTGGVKNNTIVFVNEKILIELNCRIDNGRNLSMKFIPAKLEAYKSLVCSSSTPVSYPQGVIVVRDCVTNFMSDVIELDDTELEQPSMKYIKNRKIELNDSDGYGLAAPSLMKRWGEELGEMFVLPACVIRNSFCKGSVFPIDFHKFANEHNIETIVDIWGNVHSIKNIELILTESMLKLWDSYSSINDYIHNCKRNNYTFAITKSSEEELENVRTMNYQFLQSYNFTDKQIEELIEPTVSEIKNILTDDYRKSILYILGIGLNENNIHNLSSSFASALLIEPQLFNDPFIKQQIHTMIKKRINDAKVGVLKVPGNYSIVSGDPYSLCQSMFNLEVTGLLCAGQIYSKYWVDQGVNKIVSFRAPMTSHNNIRLLDVVHNDKMDEFYKYMTTPTIFNSWDTCADAMNGMDKDGDSVINTSLPLLVQNTKKLPAIMCVQRKAEKCIPTEKDFVQSNINSFGNAVGAVTNRITSMFETQSKFDRTSREYRVLDYRIKCGQLYQQNQIDKTKGIEAKDMPSKWYSWISNKPSNIKTLSERKQNWLNRRLLADKKPYFMQYIYPHEKVILTNYIKKNDEKCFMKFRISFDDLILKQNKTKEEEKFINCYYKRLPMGISPCTINKICWKIEEIFDVDIYNTGKSKFDFSILKCDLDYSNHTYKKIKTIYDRYKRELSNYMQYTKLERIKSDDCQTQKYILKSNFKRQCLEQCPNEDILCNIVVDLCYSKTKISKQFAWDVCGDVFLKNLLKRKNYIVSYPTLDTDGDIHFDGNRFSMKTIQLKEVTNSEDDICQLY